jgi:hypothetical protein
MRFAVAHAMQLEDGSYAVRSPEFPGCEARNSRVDIARKLFGDVLRERLLAMIAAGEVPALFTYEELATSFPERCRVQMMAPDRLPGTFDRVMAVRATIAPDDAARIEGLRVAPQRRGPHGDAKPPPAPAPEVPPHDTSAAEPGAQRLEPSARLALVAARLARRDHQADGTCRPGLPDSGFSASKNGPISAT